MLIIVFAIVLLGYGSYARAVPLITAQTTLPAIATSDVAITWPAQGQAALGVLGQGIMAETATQTPVPTASTTKLMVAHMVLKKYPLEPGQQGPTFTITPGNVAEYNDYIARGGSALRVEAGEQFTQYQALQALLLPSANNIADLLAVWAYGSLPAYFDAANAEAKVLGMNQSTFGGDASGLSPKTTSTAHDMLLLAQAVIGNPVIAEVVRQKSAVLPVVGTVLNTNILLGQNGIIGVKTGNTDEAGGAYVFAAEHALPNAKTITAIGVIMASPSLGSAMSNAIPLLNSFYQGFGDISVVPQNTEVASYTTAWGQTGTGVAAQPVTVMGWKATKPSVAAEINSFAAPAAQGTEIGVIKATTPYAEATTPIILAQSVTQPDWMWRVIRR